MCLSVGRCNNTTVNPVVELVCLFWFNKAKKTRQKCNRTLLTRSQVKWYDNVRDAVHAGRIHSMYKRQLMLPFPTDNPNNVTQSYTRIPSQ